ncbi:hypothetical protein CAP36_03130 [Chitinophagaceae bacterium IBVUCB2]|nr:hypothetical protein CAP36_03130 [Chitinophagaceae bacterium IBVUCB2]
MHKLLLIICFYSLCAQTVVAQNHVTDSLLKLATSAKEDTVAVHLYFDIGSSYENNNPQKAKEYYRKAGELSNKLGFTAGSIKFFTYYSSTFMVEGNLDSMLYFNEQALALSRLAKDSLNIGIALFNIGIAYRQASNFEKAIEYCLEGRVIMEAKGHKKIEVQMNDALLALYNSRTEYQKAIPFGVKAVQQARELKMKEFLPQPLLNLSLAYLETNEYDKAEGLIKEALQLAKEINDTRIEAVATQNMASVFMRKGDYGKMEIFALRSLALYKQIGSIDGEAGALRALAVCYLQKKDFLKAKEYAEQSLAICRANNYKQEESSILGVLSSIHYAMNDVVNGLKFDTESNAILETMVREVISQQSANLEKKYETAKKESQIKDLEANRKVQQLTIQQKNTLNYILIGSAAVLLLISLLGYRNYRTKQKFQQQRINELETEKQLTATEAVLKGEEQERTRLAKDLHDGLGGMLSGIKYSFQTMKGNLVMTPDNQQAFERSMDMLDSSIKEMRRVAHNMMPEALVKFGLDTALKDFCNDINQSGALQVSYQSIGMQEANVEQTTAITIYRIVQELINNTMKHAAAKTAIVQVSKEGQAINITVEDDGKGFNTAILQRANGIGWSNIQSRIEYLKGNLDVQSAPGRGTSVHIEINL